MKSVSQEIKSLSLLLSEKERDRANKIFLKVISLENFIREIRDSFECEPEAHKTKWCRSCEARVLLEDSML